MSNPYRKALAALIVIAASIPASIAAAADAPGISDEAGKRLTVAGPDGKPLLRYEYAHERDDDRKVTFDTAKVFHHVIAPNGEPITKGPGGQFPHHRGIFIGWNKIKHNGKSHDLWHVRNTTQKHATFVKQEYTNESATIATRIDWIGTEGKPVIEETRPLTLRFTDDQAYALIDFVSELTAAHGDVELNGDPEHAGIQFRPSQKVAENKSAKYTFHADGIKAQKDVGLPWVAETFEIDGKKWTVQHMSHPDNPDGSRWSAYRDYGRFGEFPVIKIADGETVALRYRFRVTEGEAPDRAKLAEAYEAYTK